MHDTNRMERLSVWLKGIDSDITAFQELDGFTSQSFREFAKSWGHHHVLLSKEDGTSPLGVTSRFPITLVKYLEEGFYYGLLHVRCRTLNLLITHLNPKSWEARLKEAEKIVQYAQTIGNSRIVLLGDLNALSPVDANYMENAGTDIKLEHVRSSNLLYGREFDYSAVSKLLSLPLCDLTYRYVPEGERITWPSPLVKKFPSSPHAQKRYGCRLDFIMGNVDVYKHTADSFIFNRDGTDYLSEHYPVAVDLWY